LERTVARKAPIRKMRLKYAAKLSNERAPAKALSDWSNLFRFRIKPTASPRSAIQKSRLFPSPLIKGSTTIKIMPASIKEISGDISTVLLKTSLKSM